MHVKQLLKDYSLKKAALLLAEQRLRLRNNPGDDMLFERSIGMVHLAHEIFNNYNLMTLYNHYCCKLDQPLPKPGETVIYYDPLEDHHPKPAKVIESRDSTTLDQPKLVKCECEGQVLEIQDRHIYLLLYW